MSFTGKSKTVAFAPALGLGAWCVVFAVFAEILLAIPRPVWLYGLLGALSLAPGVVRPNWPAGCTATVVVASLLACLLAPWNSRKAVFQRLHTIRPGMTESQARQIMAGYTEGTGWPATPVQPEGTGGTLQDVGSGRTFRTTADTNGDLAFADSPVFRQSNDGRFNSDWGVIQFKDGRVIRVEFLPD